MKKKQITALTLAFLLCLSALCGCGGKKGYSDDIAVSSIADRVDEATGKNDGSMIAVDESYIKGSMKMDPSGFEEYVVKINAYGANIDEYGIFKGADEKQTKEIESQVEAYLKMRNDTWMTEYMPEEHPKMEKASFVTYGNYVMYAILDDDIKQTAFDAMKGCLMEG